MPAQYQVCLYMTKDTNITLDRPHTITGIAIWSWVDEPVTIREAALVIIR